MASITRGGVDDAPQGDEGKAPASRGQPNYSGRLLLRMPRSLHAELAQRAEREGTSLNQLIIGTLSGSLDVDAASPPASGEPVATESEPTETAEPEATRRTPRFLTLALALNLVVIVAAGAIAVALLIAAWQGGL